MSLLEKEYFATVNGGGSASGTSADPASLDRAQTLARAYMAGGGQSCTVWMDGRFFINSIFGAPMNISAADLGIDYRQAPGKSATISAGVPITGGWTGPDANGVYSISFSGTTRDLWVNGIRATRARSALLPSGFTKSANGYVDAGSVIASLARPQDVEIVGQNQWKFFKVRVLTAVATAVVIRTSDWNRSQYQSPYNLGTVWWYENAKELVQNGQGYWYHDRNANVLYYKPRTGEVMGTVEVIAGILEAWLNPTDSLGGSNLNVNFRGIVFEHTTWLYPDANGYTPIQSGILLTASDGSAYKKIDAGLPINSIKGLKFWTCQFNKTGGAGVSCDYGAQNITFHNCSTDDTAGPGFIFGDASHIYEDPFPSDVRQKISYLTLFNILVNHNGAVYYDSPGIASYYCDHITADRIEVKNSPYDGLSFGWGWGENDPSGNGWPAGFSSAPVTTNANGNNTWNRVKATLFQQQLADSGGIYINGRQDGTTITNSYAHAGGSGTFKFPFYFDNGAAGVTYSNNVAEGAPTYSVEFNQGGGGTRAAVNNVLTNNYATVGSVSPAHASNTITGYTVGALDATAQAIKDDAGVI